MWIQLEGEITVIERFRIPKTDKNKLVTVTISESQLWTLAANRAFSNKEHSLFFIAVLSAIYLYIVTLSKADEGIAALSLLLATTPILLIMILGLIYRARKTYFEFLNTAIKEG